MSIKAYLKQIGRGSKGASDLSRAEAKDLFLQILSSATSELELGAFCMAMRIKGETSEELSGFYDALRPFLPSIMLSKPVWLLPSYNGARKTRLLTPLLAKLLAEKGYFVLVHGTHEEPQRTSSEQLFAEMAWPVAKTLAELPLLLEHQSLAYCPLSVLCPALHRLLMVRQVIGVRNTGHVLAKVLNPIQSQSFQLNNYTHPAYPAVLEGFYTNFSENVATMRGHEGEPVASPRRLPELHLRFKGLETVRVLEPQYFSEEAEALDSILPAATAALYQTMLANRNTLPPSLVAQVNALHEAYAMMTNPLTRPLP
jgi:anthranilate phosphoribosyltransferase